MHLDPNSYLNTSLGNLNSMRSCYIGNPFRADTARRQDDVFGFVYSPVGFYTFDCAIFNQHFFGLFGVVKNNAFFCHIISHFCYMIGKIIAAKVFLFDDQ